MIDEELKKCPCCGGKAEVYEDYDYFSNPIYYIRCDECGLQTQVSYFKNEHEMINTWNKRVGDNDD